MANSANDSKLPKIPLLQLASPEIKDYSYQMFFQKEHLRMLNGQTSFNCIKSEVDNKYKSVYDNNQKNSTVETEGTNDAYINITLYGFCHRCKNWLLKSEMELHLSFHAAIILDYLLLGDKFCSMSYKELILRNHVTHVVNAASQLTNYFEKQGLQYLHLELMDNLSEDVIEQCKRAAHWINKIHEQNQNSKIFVHCAMGKSRSVSDISSYESCIKSQLYQGEKTYHKTQSQLYEATAKF